MGVKKADDTEVAETTQEKTIKRTFDRRFAMPLDFNFF